MSALTFHDNIETALLGGITAALATLGAGAPKAALLSRDFKPTIGVPYAEVVMLWGNERAIDIPALTTRIDALCQVNVYYPKGQGGHPVNAAVGAIRAQFRDGATVSAHGTVVYTRGVKRAGGSVVQGFLKAPLTVRFFAYDINPS